MSFVPTFSNRVLVPWRVEKARQAIGTERTISIIWFFCTIQVCNSQVHVRIAPNHTHSKLYRTKRKMAPIPEPQLPAPFDSDDEESLLLLASVGKKYYTGDELEHDSSATSTTWGGDDNLGQETRNECLIRLWDGYYSALEQWPLTVKSITAFSLMTLADFLAQLVQHLRCIPDPNWVDVLRSLRFGVFGLLGAPWTHYYYDWLDRTFPPTPQPWTFTTAGKQRIYANLLGWQGLESTCETALCLGDEGS